MSQNLFCPYCRNQSISQFENNRPVADFYCPNCIEEYELKSKNGSITNKINDGAYAKKIKLVESGFNPNFFFMYHDKSDLKVKKFIMISKYFFQQK